MSAKHTKGPWNTHKRDDEKEATLVKHTSGDGDFLVCVTNLMWRAEERNAANARLISTAPELLEALEDALSEWEGHNGRLTDPTHPHWSNAARAIIAKATGSVLDAGNAA